MGNGPRTTSQGKMMEILYGFDPFFLGGCTFDPQQDRQILPVKINYAE